MAEQHELLIVYDYGYVQIDATDLVTYSRANSPYNATATLNITRDTQKRHLRLDLEWPTGHSHVHFK